jgi:hypothetical protein
MSAAAEQPLDNAGRLLPFLTSGAEGLFEALEPLSSSRPRVGAEELELEFAMTGGSVDLFTEVLGELGHRSDTVRNATTFTSAWPTELGEELFLVSDLRPEARRGRSGGDSRRLTRLIDNGAIETDAICRRLAAEAAPLAEAMVLEVEEIPPTKTSLGCDMASISLVGPNVVAPVWFGRNDIPVDRPGLVEDDDRLLAAGVVEKARADLEDLGLEVPPLIAHDPRFGENGPFRLGLQELDVEYILVVPNDFDEALIPRSSKHRGRIGGVLDEVMRFGADGSAPEPRLVSTGPHKRAHTYAFAVPGRPPLFALVNPGDRSAPGGLTGNRGKLRGAELVDLLLSSARPRVLQRFGLDHFHHPGDEGWRAAGALLSLRRAAACGLLLPSPR